ncbi:hypothetical protein [Kordia jejudonensis]|uniref:hypothetical protein n=1 Tax=Kordia jejudonensis TaxID=1348245 RepID=UPI0012E01C5B|nr:hypothetical protein [Kordia jejudonensis]
MKKKSLKNLGLKKESISNLSNTVTGGERGGESTNMFCPTTYCSQFTSCDFCPTSVCDTQVTCPTWVTCDCPVLTE